MDGNLLRLDDVWVESLDEVHPDACEALTTSDPS